MTQLCMVKTSASNKTTAYLQILTTNDLRKIFQEHRKVLWLSPSFRILSVFFDFSASGDGGVNWLVMSDLFLWSEVEIVEIQTSNISLWIKL